MRKGSKKPLIQAPGPDQGQRKEETCYQISKIRTRGNALVQKSPWLLEPGARVLGRNRTWK